MKTLKIASWMAAGIAAFFAFNWFLNWELNVPYARGFNLLAVIVVVFWGMARA